MTVSLLIAFACATSFAQQSHIVSVSPSSGPIAGGTIVTITGMNFAGATVTLDRSPLVPISHSDSEIQLRMPKHDNGYAVIAIGTSYGEFLFVPPRLEELPPGYITTIAGVGFFSGDYRPAIRAFVAPWGISFDASDNVYIAEAANDRVVRVRADGVLEPFAGNRRIGGQKPRVPTPGLNVPIAYPRSVAIDSSGNVYIPDTEHYIWRVSPDGLARVIAGTGKEPFSGDAGPAIDAAVGHPTFMAIDERDNLYFISWSQARIRKIDPAGIITTVAGTGTYGFSGDDGPAVQAQFNIPGPDNGGLVSDRAGNLFLLDYGNKRIRRIDAATGIITTVAQAGQAGGSSLNDLQGLAIDSNGNLYFTNASELLKRTSDGVFSRLTNRPTGYSPDGTLLSEARLAAPRALTISSRGELVMSELSRVRRIDSSGRLQTIAGIGPDRPDEGRPATEAVIVNAQVDLDITPTGEIVFGDNDKMRKIDRAGIITSIAGTGFAAPLEGVRALEAQVAPNAIAIAADGSIDFFSNFGTFRIDLDGIVRRTAGVFTLCDFTGDDGSALDARFCQPADVARDRAGNLLIADTNNNRIRRVDRTTGVITTIAGSGSSNGWEHYGDGRTCGDGGPATQACLNTPLGIVEDGRGNIYVSHIDVNGRIRKIDSAGTITTFAEALATKMTTLGDVLYAVSGERVLRFAADGTATTIAGKTGEGGFSGDGGPASEALILARKLSHGIAIDADGNLFFSDGDNRRIRAIRFGGVLAPPGAKAEASRVGSTIRVEVRDGAGRPASSVRVDFAAPSAGATCALSSAFAITNAEGIATVSCTPNCVAGAYDVIARPLTGSSTSSVSFVNAATPCRRRAVRR